MNDALNETLPRLQAPPRPPSRSVPRSTSAWHTLSVAAALDRLDTAEGGLSSAEAARRLAAHGPNELEASGRASPWSLLLAQFKNVLS